MARLADRFGWGRDTLLELEHRERRRWLAELDHLQRIYERLNTAGDVVGRVACPQCRQDFDVDLADIQDPSSGK
jgi:hypothetical protein